MKTADAVAYAVIATFFLALLAYGPDSEGNEPCATYSDLKRVKYEDTKRTAHDKIGQRGIGRPDMRTTDGGGNTLYVREYVACSADDEVYVVYKKRDKRKGKDVWRWHYVNG